MKNESELRERNGERIGLLGQVLLAALECSAGDLQSTFTAEDLLLTAWKHDRAAWGLRGHEAEHPDSERIYTSIDRTSVRGGIVGMGLFEKVRQRTYRLTPAGLKAASEVAGADPIFKGKAERQLADAVASILSHPVFREWLTDAATLKRFREAGHFWGIAPGTPASVIRARIRNVDNTLNAASSLLKSHDTDEIAARHGKRLFDRNDIQRALEFQATLKRLFAKDLATLGVDLQRNEAR